MITKKKVVSQFTLVAGSSQALEIVNHKRQKIDPKEHHRIRSTRQYYNAIPKILLSPHHDAIQTLPKPKKEGVGRSTQKQASVCFSHAYLYVAATLQLRTPARAGTGSIGYQTYCMWVCASTTIGWWGRRAGRPAGRSEGPASVWREGLRRRCH